MSDQDLDELDRPAIERTFEPWNRTVRFRALSAADWLELLPQLAELGETPDNSPQMIRFFAQLLSRLCIDPAADADAWLTRCRLSTLVALGNMALEVANLIPSEEKKID